MKFSFQGFHLVSLRAFREKKEGEHFPKSVVVNWGRFAPRAMPGDNFDGYDL